MTDRFLLYIDILGFTEMVAKDPRKVARVYSILNTLNVHNHNSFTTIVFSDTILVYNNEAPANDDGRQYLVMYLTEFAEDLHDRLIGQDIYFRAALVAGEFFHYELDHVDCFYGSALIKAYKSEKDIPSLGLFMDNECAKYNQVFRLARFNEEFSFVYLNKHLEYLDRHAFGVFPTVFDLPPGDIAPDVFGQIKFLQHIYDQMRSHPLPHVRSKFLTAWDFYKKRHPQMLRVLEDNQFKADSLGASSDWLAMERVHNQNVAYFKRIGSGTQLSTTITGTAKKSAKRSARIVVSKPTSGAAKRVIASIKGQQVKPMAKPASKSNVKSKPGKPPKP
jgi:hypothetical protein